LRLNYDRKCMPELIWSEPSFVSVDLCCWWPCQRLFCSRCLHTNFLFTTETKTLTKDIWHSKILERLFWLLDI
jgi:hypothetical protein